MREGLDLGRRGNELLLAGRQAGDAEQINEGGVLLAEGSMRLDTAALERESAGTCADPGE